MYSFLRLYATYTTDFRSFELAFRRVIQTFIFIYSRCQSCYNYILSVSHGELDEARRHKHSDAVHLCYAAFNV